MRTMADARGRADHDVATVVPSEEPGLARALVKGSAVGFVAVFVVMGCMALAAGTGIGAAVGVGAFTALWGGPGFGGMMGAVLYCSRAEAKVGLEGSPQSGSLGLNR